MSALVSILIPCYQDGAFLRQTIAAALSQSYENLEVIVSDEGVDPICREISLSFSDQRLRYFCNSQRLGMTQNWNQALSHANGKYILKLDGDDVINVSTIEKLVDALQQDARAKWAGCLTQECNEQLENGQLYGERGFSLSPINPYEDQTLQPENVFPWLFADVQLWHSCALMFERKTMESLHGWNPQFGCASDTDIILRALNAGLPIAHIHYSGILYRKRDESVSHQFRQDNRLLWEGSITHLQAATQWIEQGNPVSKPLSIGWYRHWCRLEILKNGPISKNDAYYLQMSKEIKPPPLPLRLKEKARYTLHPVIQRFNPG